MDKGLESSGNAVILKKVSKLTENEPNQDEDFYEALKGLSTFLGQNTIQSRRGLRNTLEKRSLYHNQQYFNSLDGVKTSLDSLRMELISIDATCDQAMNKLKGIKARNQILVERTSGYKQQLFIAKRQQELAEKFIDAFQMKPEEIVILKGPLVKDKSVDIVIDDRFFELLFKCRRIHENAKLLLKSINQTTGMEAMASMESLEDAAFDRLYKWTLDRLRNFDPDSSSMCKVQKAIKLIAERPVLFKHSLDEYATVRRSVIVRNLIDALTRGGPSNNPPPIDFHSNDPVRYVGDILAWVHQAKASEKELLSLITYECEPEFIETTCKAYLSIITESLFRPVKSRIDLLISSTDSKKSHDPLILFKVKNLIKFYRRILSEDLQSDSQLVHTMTEIDSLAHRVFINSLNFHCAYKFGQNSESNMDEPPSNLNLPEWYIRTLRMLGEILSLQNSSFLTPDESQEVMITLVNVVIKPMLQACRISASRLPGLEMSIFLLNCYNEIHTLLSRSKHVDDFKTAVKQQMDDFVESLINENCSSVMSYLDLIALHNSIKNEANLPLSTITGCDPVILQPCSKKIATFLARPESVLLPQLIHLRDDTLRKRIKKESFTLLSQMYEEIHRAVHKKENGYDEPESLLPQAPEEFRVSLSKIELT